MHTRRLSILLFCFKSMVSLVGRSLVVVVGSITDNKNIQYSKYRALLFFGFLCTHSLIHSFFLAWIFSICLCGFLSLMCVCVYTILDHWSFRLTFFSWKIYVKCPLYSFVCLLLIIEKQLTNHWSIQYSIIIIVIIILKLIWIHWARQIILYFSFSLTKFWIFCLLPFFY